MAKSFDRLVEIMKTLRGPQGCPWDREQTPETLKPYLIEEAYEAVEALDKKEPEKVKEELGDLLLQILFHAQIAAEENQFTIDDIVAGAIEKLIRRHPHVFGTVTVKDAQEVLRNWSRFKTEEGSLLSGVPRQMPALLQAQTIGEKVSRLGFDWESPRDCMMKIKEELAELEESLIAPTTQHPEEEIGDLLFSLANLSRLLNLNAEITLRKAIEKFRKRFKYIESKLKEKNADFSRLARDDLEALWQEAKKGGL